MLTITKRDQKKTPLLQLLQKQAESTDNQNVTIQAPESQIIYIPKSQQHKYERNKTKIKNQQGKLDA